MDKPATYLICLRIKEQHEIKGKRHCESLQGIVSTTNAKEFIQMKAQQKL